MQFRTTFNIRPFETKITHKSKLFSMGSCFSTMIGEKLLERKFNVLNNPFGTIFNPNSLFRLLQQALSKSKLDPHLLLEHQQRFYHYGIHSSISAKQEVQLWERIEASQTLAKEYLTHASHIFITFGTAHIYELKASGKQVTNCHKQPQSLFNKRLLGLEEMKGHFGNFFALQKNINPKAPIILTVSPVRHTKDGIPENQVSKSLLRVLAHQLEEEFEGVSYFPSYELMMDDLRDYRFYKGDMVHPTPQAEDYIWGFFKECYLDKSTVENVQIIEGIMNSLGHRPFHPESEVYQQFLQNLLQKMERMSPKFDFSKEVEEVKSKLETDF
ncbi:MAG: GSCFA domain-containing protein [Anditalea sp.]